MIGLKRHTVRVVDSQPAWGELAAEECRKVAQAGGELIADVQHVGSTAVPGLPAKPILDLAAGVSSLDTVFELAGKLVARGYSYRGDGGDEGGHLFLWESAPDVRTVHLHVVEHGCAQWLNYVRFRDLLRENAGIRKEYAELKLGLCREFPNDRESYTALKHDFIQRALGKQER